LDALILALEADKGFCAVETDQGDHANPRARWKYGVGGGGGVCCGDQEQRGREQASDQGHENSIRLHGEPLGDRKAAPLLALDTPLGRAAFSGFAVPATGRPALSFLSALSRGPSAPPWKFRQCSPRVSRAAGRSLTPQRAGGVLVPACLTLSF